MRETGVNQILVRFLLAKSPTRGLNVLKFPFSRVVTPLKREQKRPANVRSTAKRNVAVAPG